MAKTTVFYLLKLFLALLDTICPKWIPTLPVAAPATVCFTCTPTAAPRAPQDQANGHQEPQQAHPRLGIINIPLADLARFDLPRCRHCHAIFANLVDHLHQCLYVSPSTIDYKPVSDATHQAIAAAQDKSPFLHLRHTTLVGSQHSTLSAPTLHEIPSRSFVLRSFSVLLYLVIAAVQSAVPYEADAAFRPFPLLSHPPTPLNGDPHPMCFFWISARTRLS
jgi:hypothetical protein